MRHHLVLPATVVVAGTSIFLALADAASENDGPTTIDPTITHAVVQDRSAAATTAARVLTLIGSEAVLSVVTLVVVIWLLERRHVRRAVTLGVAMAGSAMLTVGAKLAVGRPRPGAALRLGPADGSYSFPSGHTLNSTVLLAMIGVLVVPLLGSLSVRRATWTGLTILAAGIGLSRVYLGYHWFTDVAGSWVLAAVWVTAVVAVDRLGASRRRSGGGQVRSPMLGT